jgi:hypothetical protein
MASLKELIIIDEVVARLINEKKYGISLSDNDSGISYVSVNVWDLEISRNIEKSIWKMPEFYGVISNWCDIQSRCRVSSIQFVA